MDAKELNNLINKYRYQVFVFTCPVSLPFNFALHPWFVVNKKGSITRWEVLFRKMKHKTRWGHLYMDYFQPTQGVEIMPFLEKFYWKSTLLGYIEGDENSIARKMADFIENSKTYPYCDKYSFSFTGPNSNTYAQWVLDKFPELKIKLPWNSFGKNFKK